MQNLRIPLLKKMSNRIRGNAISSIQTGNDFLCYVAYQGNEDLVTVEVQDYNGKNKYSLDCSAACDNGTASYANCHFALGVWEDEILLVSKKEYFVLNMATKPLQRLLTSKQITSTTLPWTATRLPNNGHPCGSRGKFLLCPAQSDRGRKNNRLQNWILHKGK